MPAQVVVVKRSRRRAFAILRSVPAWWRALLVSFRSTRAPSVPFDLEELDAWSDTGMLAPERSSGISTPRLIAAADLEDCEACIRCVQICPSDALALDRQPVSDAPKSFRFELDPGRCIGCADCVRVCPSGLLEMNVEYARVGVGREPASRSLAGDGAHSVRY
jgi:ferredoxin